MRCPGRLLLPLLAALALAAAAAGPARAQQEPPQARVAPAGAPSAPDTDLSRGLTARFLRMPSRTDYPGWLQRMIDGENPLVAGYRFARRPISLSAQPGPPGSVRPRPKGTMAIAFSLLAARLVSRHEIELSFRIPLGH
jgi:hypothetical protein